MNKQTNLKSLPKKRAGKGSCTKPYNGRGGILGAQLKRLGERRQAFDKQADKQGYKKPGSMSK